MSTLDYRDIPEERLATTDEYGNRLFVIPAIVQGTWAKRKSVVHGLLLCFLLLLPWIKVAGKPAVLLNLPEREFTFFGTTLYAHDGPLIFFLLAIAAMTLAFVTVIWGRVWCGWGCPQTVFIEAVFRRIERVLLGDRPQQLAFYKSPLSFDKISKLAMKWTLFIAASAVISHTLVSYFVGVDSLFQMMSAPPAESWTVFVIMLFITGVILFDFAWFREQFCIIMCPYGRLQGLLLDQNSITIAYDEKRGEPRGKLSAKTGGACVDCYRCVAVCPTGIDIRQGQQLECIGCTACIDACNDVMTKVGRAPDLISYRSLKNLDGFKTRFLRPRAIVFAVIIFMLSSGFIYSIAQRGDLNVEIIRGVDTPYQTLVENNIEYVTNHFKLHMKNQSASDITVNVSLPSEFQDQGFTLNPQPLALQLHSKQTFAFPIFLKIPKASTTSKNTPIFVNIQLSKSSKTVRKPLFFVSP
jgi:cytochrome c oxidase accessory protein FixG